MSEETLVGGEAEVTESNGEQTTNEETSLVGGSEAEGSTEVEVKEETAEEVKEIEYEDFKLPEGIVLDGDFTGEFKNIAKELKLNQDQAQKLVDLQTKFTQTHAEKINADFKATVTQWKEESIQELGPNYKAEMQVVAKAMDNFGTPELRALLNETGLGNHKEVVKFFHSIGKKISEDKFRDGTKKVEKSLAEKHYPNTKY